VENPLVPLRARIADIRAETADTRTYTLHPGEGAFGPPRPGQFNMVGYPGVGEAPISLSSLPRNGTFQHTIRAAGRVTGFLARLKRGDELFLRGPYGAGWPMEEAARGLVIVAGGLGLAPVRPVVHEIAADRGAFGEVSLLAGARDPMSMLYRDEVEEWKRHMRVLLTVDEVPHGAQWGHEVGLITALLDRIRIDPERTAAFVCGPEIMMRFAARTLIMKGMPPSRVFVSLERRMKCGVAQCGHCQHGSKFVCRDGPVFAYGEVSGLPDSLL